MSAIRDGRVSVELDTERKILFSLNVLDDLQDKFGGYDKLGEALSGPDGIRNLKWLLTRLLNEALEDGETLLTELQVGKMVHMGNLLEVKTAIFAAFNKGTAGDETAGEDAGTGDSDETADDETESEGEAKNGKAGKGA